jgi:hypothetical protein
VGAPGVLGHRRDDRHIEPAATAAAPSGVLQERDVERLTALGISIGVLAGPFTWFAGTVTQLGSWQSPFVVWVGFASWACSHAAGGRSQWSVCCSPTPPRSSVTSWSEA